MKIFSTPQIKEMDRFTIQQEPIESIDLMERAAEECCKWISENILTEDENEFDKIKILCGLGNNGGDGLAIARILSGLVSNVEVYIIKYSNDSSPDFIINEERLKKIKELNFHYVESSNDIPSFSKSDLVIDAILGSGLNKMVEGLAAEVIHAINSSKAKVVAIDVPSGLFCDSASIIKNAAIVKANHTLTFQLPKLAFMFPENYEYVGEWHLLDINLSQQFIDHTSTKNHYLTKDIIQSFLHHRSVFSHKGTYGHAMIIAGSYGKMGAAVLASKACLRVGVGLLTTRIPKCGYEILQTSTPEAMIETDEEMNFITSIKNTEVFNAIAVGPGIGMEKQTQIFLKILIQQSSIPMIIDADAINLLAENKTWLSFLPKGSIFTPHPKEFERLVGKSSDNFERMKMQQEFSFKYSCYVILKGAHTCISFPDGTCYFNSTGNSGMATAGSGDVLTGILAGLFAQGYSSSETCLLGVFIHGLAGDIAKEKMGEEAMIASDIIANLGNAYKALKE